MENILVVDVGTSSLKAMLYTRAGHLLHSAASPYDSEFGRKPNYVEQDPQTWKQALLDTLKSAGDHLATKGFDVAAIAVTSQRASVIPVDRDGVPLHKALMWQDKRSIPQCERLLGELPLEEMYKRTGLLVNPYFSVPKMMWLKEHRPHIYEPAHKLIGVQDYVVHLLCGRFVTDSSQACRTMLMNIGTFQWDEEMLGVSGIDRALLPDLVPPGTAVGTLTRAMAEHSGLKEGIPVILGGGDQQCAALSLDVLRPGAAEANTGTGSFVIAYSDEPRFHPECRTLCSAAAVPGKWIVEAGIFTTGLIHRWFKEQFYPEGKDAYALMNAEAQSSPPGAKGVLLIPHFEGSAAPYWNPLARGLFFNLTMATTRADMARAVVEGIAFEIAKNLQLLEGLGVPIDSVRVAGGLTTLDLFNQVQADAFAKPVLRYDNNEASSLGALMSAAVTLGLYQDHQEAFRTILDTDPRRYEPEDAATRRYRRILERKDALYEALNANGIYDTFNQVLE
ncbi:FGGY family carbohydrate kinase [Rhodoplanes sp. TEM]|uniref:FGGY family carbohydrate kinase n=1 Tax=Rhodoplanes tepidamans TaxID=200616 RepID=A0ABT5JD89_RHOTP|nr:MULTISPECIES: FGGY-family carbohydrate kinase [Rhodoplanes]MDC7787644.1 FGGY family carbohydrate kinase [Rhodoplanes tepidamans]MDC7984540.1 FGGY family carbohydrate kinase [Rhodoplanes sp. TEM]MDQ0355214.1 xylulokinase/glycerol kinase [Rhodoplanes tepidamans]